MKTKLLLILAFFSISTFADHIEVDGWKFIPNVDIEVYQDIHSGMNLKVMAKNFIFDPENVGMAHEEGHGHGHLYINGKKATRIYNEWVHIPSDWLKRGDNVIAVTLNANTHEELWYREVPISDTESAYYSGSHGGGGHHHHH